MRREAIRAVICDAGGVLLHPDFDWICIESSELGAVLSRQDLHLAYYRMIHEVDLDTGMDRRGMAVDSDAIRLYLMTRLLRGANVPEATTDRLAAELARRTATRFPRESDIFHFAMPEVKGQLEGLRAAGFALAVASNNDGALESQLARVELSGLLRVRLDSAIEGVSKPDPELLLRAAEQLSVPPADCLYVGDIDRVDGAAARAAGMHFALLDPVGLPRPTNPLRILSVLNFQG